MSENDETTETESTAGGGDVPADDVVNPDDAAGGAGRSDADPEEDDERDAGNTAKKYGGAGPASASLGGSGEGFGRPNVPPHPTPDRDG